MEKRIKTILSCAGIYLLVFLCCSPLAYAVDGSKQTPFNGHRCEVSGSTKQVCANCHIPHGGKGIRIWARSEIEGKEQKTKTLCASCHYAGNKDFPGIQSGLLMKDTGQWCGGQNADKNNINGNVFLEGKSANHVMGAQFKPNIDNDTDYLSPKGKAEVVGFPFSKDEGFYCGSCHNPHKQPNGDESGNGDYLRLKEGVTSAGTTHDRRQFCRQCHPRKGTKTAAGINNGEPVSIHASEDTDPQCEACHRPHDGYPSSNGVDNTAIFIYKVDIPSKVFVWPPERTRYSNAPNIEPLSKPYESVKCLGCHMSKDWPNSWPNAPQLSKNHAHHPMGHTWEKTSCAECHSGPKIGDHGKLIRLDGFDESGNPLTTGQIFSCTSCHGAHTTNIDGNPSFLRYASFKDDNTAFCEYCHNDEKNHPKSRAFLEANSGKHFKTVNDPDNHVYRTFKATSDRSERKVKSGGCMFCHFIHQNDTDPRVIPAVSPRRADLRALMRVPARQLDWGYQGNIAVRTDPFDRYEALCYGCHGDSSIVGKYEEGSLLNPTAHFSHRFACKVTGTNTLINIGHPGQFPLGDGTPGAGPGKEGVMDDYGTVQGEFYCGSCHDVHINTKPPYLYRLKISDNTYESKSPYEPNGFCEQCHCTADTPDPMGVGSTHPVGFDKVPALPKTGLEFPKQFAGGKSGSPLGITAGNNTVKDGVICLTCHNVHAASTSWNGTAALGQPIPPVGKKGIHGQLLVMDNYSEAPGSNMCRACHQDF